MFSGLRVHDPDVLSEIFGKMRRSLAEMPRSKLVTCLENKDWAWIDAFDAPFVAQSLRWVAPGQIEMEFPGGHRETLAIEDFEIDDWNRFHALVGPHSIPAVLSRKAQATLLNLLASENTLPNFRRFRQPRQQSPSAISYWSEAYDQGLDGWELGGPHPFLLKQDWTRFEGARVLVPGSGRGHDAYFLATSIPGAHVTALDFAPEARAESERLYPGLASLEYATDDVFEFLKREQTASWDLVFEHTFFCAIDPLRRQEYLRELCRVLKPAGRWLGLFFLLEHDGGAPFALTQWELRELTRSCFEIRAWSRVQDSPKGRTHKELWAEFSRRSI